MLLREAVKLIRAGHGIPGTAVLYGDEPYIQSVGVQELTKAAQVRLPAMNLITFEGRPQMEELQVALTRCPFMSDTKIVVLRETDLLSTGVPAALSRPLEKMQLDGSTLFVITMPGNLDRRKNYVKQLLKSAVLIPCNPLEHQALSRFILSEAKQRSRRIGGEAVEALAERTRGDAYTVVSELDKLASICDEEITIEDIEAYTAEPDELNMFRISDALTAGQYARGFREVTRLLADDPTPLALVAFLTNLFPQMLVARACRDANYAEPHTIECICAETGVKEWAARRAYRQSVGYSADKLRYNLQKLADVDFDVKQGKVLLATALYALLEDLFRTE